MDICFASCIFASTCVTLTFFSSLPSPAYRSAVQICCVIVIFLPTDYFIASFSAYHSFLHFLAWKSHPTSFFQTLFLLLLWRQNVSIHLEISFSWSSKSTLHFHYDTVITSRGRGGVAPLICCLPIILQLGGTAASFSRQTGRTDRQTDRKSLAGLVLRPRDALVTAALGTDASVCVTEAPLSLPE